MFYENTWNRKINVNLFRKRKHIPGFHILLSPMDAMRYQLYNVTEPSTLDYFYKNYVVLKVDYTDVLGFGRQDCSGVSKDCVIARHMYVHSKPLTRAEVEGFKR